MPVKKISKPSPRKNRPSRKTMTPEEIPGDASDAQLAMSEAAAKQRDADQSMVDAFQSGYSELCKQTGIQLAAQVTYLGNQTQMNLVPVKVVQEEGK